MNNISLSVNTANITNGNNSSDANNTNASVVNSKKNNAVQLNTLNNNTKTSAKQTNLVNENAKKQKELGKQIESNLNPSPMLSQAMLFKWDASAGGAVINVVDFKTGKVLAQIPPNSVLKMMSNYQKGSLYNGKL